jgi:type II secretory pathway component PulF
MNAYPARTAAATNTGARSAARPAGLLQTLQSIKIGSATQRKKIKSRDLIFILRNIATLIENGLSLPTALQTIAREKTLQQYHSMLSTICRTVENGEMFSEALKRYQETFGELLIAQIKIGERSGTLPLTLDRVVQQLEHADNLKATIIKKLAYPTLLCVAGSGAITFMLLFVIPTFEKTYKDAGAKLPAITQFLIDLSRFGTSYGWMIGVALVTAVVAFVVARRNDASRLWIDRHALRLPLLGDTLRNMAVLQFMEVLGNLIEAGFTVADALRSCARAVSNHAVRERVEKLHAAVIRGERFSSKMEANSDIFPPIVNQLIIVGEKTGTLPKATQNVRAHLKREIERTLSIMVGAIEPILTLSLAAAIGCILLAIYLPMFDMIGAMGGGEQPGH